jgi:polar amino acid transport system substrate-binding protein
MRPNALSLLLLLASAPIAYAEGTIRFGVAAEPYQPFASKNAEGAWVGWEIDVKDEICRRLQADCPIVEISWDGIIPALTAGKLDVIWAGMSITDERLKIIDFTSAYYNTQTWLVGAAGGETAITAEGLAGKTVGVQTATTHAAYAEKHYGQSEIRYYATQDDANADLAAGRVDYVQGEAGAMQAFLATDAGKACCVSLGPVPADAAVLGQGIGGGLRKGDAELKARIDATIAAMAEDGTFARITAAYPELQGMIALPGEF